MDIGTEFCAYLKCTGAVSKHQDPSYNKYYVLYRTSILHGTLDMMCMHVTLASAVTIC